MITTVLISDEVEENRQLSKAEPTRFHFATTGLVYCEKKCGKALSVYAKNVNYTKWTCLDCINSN